MAFLAAIPLVLATGGIGGAAAGAGLAADAAVGAAASAGSGLFGASTIFSGLGAATSALGAINSARATAANASYQAQVANNQAITASQYAESASQTGQAKLNQEQLQNRAAIGSLTTAQAANNVDVNSGSALDVRTGEREALATNALNTMNTTQQQVYGYRVASTGDTAQAGLYQAEAAQAPAAGAIGAAGSLLGGAGSILGNYARYQLAAGSGAGGTAALAV